MHRFCDNVGINYFNTEQLDTLNRQLSNNKCFKIVTNDISNNNYDVIVNKILEIVTELVDIRNNILNYVDRNEMEKSLIMCDNYYFKCDTSFPIDSYDMKAFINTLWLDVLRTQFFGDLFYNNRTISYGLGLSLNEDYLDGQHTNRRCEIYISMHNKCNIEFTNYIDYYLSNNIQIAEVIEINNFKQNYNNLDISIDRIRTVFNSKCFENIKYFSNLDTNMCRLYEVTVNMTDIIKNNHIVCRHIQQWIESNVKQLHDEANESLPKNMNPHIRIKYNISYYKYNSNNNFVICCDIQEN